MNKDFAKILFNKELKQCENALVEIQTPGENFISLKRKIIGQLIEADIISLLKIGGELPVGKTIVTSSLLKEKLYFRIARQRR